MSRALNRLEPEPSDAFDHPWLTPTTRRTWRGLRTRQRPAIVAGLLAALVVVIAAQLMTSITSRTSVLVAARDLPAGHRLTSADVVTVSLPAESVPASAATELEELAGVLALPISAREVITTTRIARPRAADGLLIPIRLPDADVAGLLRPGDVIDVFATAPDLGGAPRAAEVVAAQVMVAAVPEALDSGLAASSGAVVVISADDRTAARLAGAASTATLSVALHP